MKFADRLRELRTSKGLSQSELAKKLNVSKSTISMLEVGSRKPSWELMEQIADYFNVDLDYLLGKEEQSRYFLDYAIYNIANELSEDSDLLSIVEKATTDADFRSRLIQIVRLMENNG